MKDMRNPLPATETPAVAAADQSGAQGRCWLMLIHQIPPQPAYFRVKIWRRLQGLGAVTVKNSVYVLPAGDETHEDLQWLLGEIRSGGGEGLICEAKLIDGQTDEETIQMFQSARDAEYAELAAEARLLLDSLPEGEEIPPDRRRQVEKEAERLNRRAAEIARIDFFAAGGRETVKGLLDGIAARLTPTTPDNAATPAPTAIYTGRIWVTRAGMHIDRIASAWLIRRFIDAKARFKYVSERSYQAAPGELRFDMFEGEFTHEGELCTFEVLIKRMGLDDPAFVPIAEIIHDIDLKDAKYAREETAGIDRLIAGIAMQHKSDDERLDKGGAVFDGLYEFFRRKRRGSAKESGQTKEES